MGVIMKLKSRADNLELFMIAVCKRLKVLPDFYDSLPDKGNAHAIEKLDALLKLKEVDNSTAHNTDMVPCYRCGEKVQINKEKYYCEKCFKGILDAQHHV